MLYFSSNFKHMKKSITLVALAAFLLVSGFSQAQKKFEGTVIYSIEFLGDVDPQQASMMPDQAKVNYKGEMSRMEMESMMGTNTVISDAKNKSGFILLNMMGKKLAMKIDEMLMEKKDKFNPDSYDVAITDETKEIAGFKCTKANVTNKETKDAFTIYFSKELLPQGGLSAQNFKGIDGMLLEFQSDMNGMKSQMTAKKVIKEKIDDSIFKMPADYKLVTQQDLMKEFGGEE